MYFKQTSFAGKRVIGIFARTTKELAVEDIGHLWERFGQEQVLETIPGIVDPAIVVVYTGYSGMNNEEYTTIIGCSVDETAEIPEGMLAVDIPAGTYATLEVEGEFSEVIPESWAAIGRSDLMRTYVADFEWYNMEEQDTEEPKATLYIGVL